MTNNIFDLLEARSTATTTVRTPMDGSSATLRSLLGQARAFAATGVLDATGDTPRIGLLLQNGPNWLLGFLAALAADCAAVPMPMPVAFTSVEHYVEHVARIADDAGVHVVITDPSDPAIPWDRLRERLDDTIEMLDICAIGSLLVDHEPERRQLSNREAVVQYTSGSTSRPKGVLLNHDNVAAGIETIRRTIGWNDDDVMGLWLPLFHDMGLFSMLSALSAGSDVCLWRPQDFVKRPLQWLQSFATSGATATPVPNFFYDLCVVSALRKGVPEGLDLSRWRVASNGAEPVQARTLDAFEAVFAPNGVEPGLIRPNYGLAEATLIVSFARRGTPRVIHHVARGSLELGQRVSPVAAGTDEARVIVGCGTAAEGVELRIAATDDTPVAEMVMGEVQIKGPSVTSGYHGLEPAEQPFSADGWCKTGDLGYLSDGELFVVGRMKGMIVVHGRNFYAEDVEEIVRITPGVNGRRSAAFTVSTGESEKMGVVWESKHVGDPVGDGVELNAISAAITERLSSQLGLDATQVVAVQAGSIPFTSSGKVKRAETRTLFIDLF